MPLLLQQHITEHTNLAVWKIEETELFFLDKVQLQQSINHPHKRLQHLAGRYLLSLLVPPFPYEELAINEAGKPYLPSGQYQFSISHCGHYAAVIISSEQQAGIDIELFSAKTTLVKNKFLSDDELSYINTLQEVNEPILDEQQLFTICWCAKEAVYKWWGNGKIDFKKDIHIQNINLAHNKLSVFFTKQALPAHLILHLILLEQLSVVWLVTSKKN